LTSINDTSERTRAEERTHAENLFRLVVEASPSAIVVVAEDGRVRLVNAQTESLFGYRRDELIGQSVDVLVPLDMRVAHSGVRAEFMTSPKARAMGAGRDLYGLRKDGTAVPIEIGLNPIATPDGTLVLASIIDITERLRAERSVRESEERFRLMVEGVTDYSLLMLDATGHVLSWNEGARRMKGYEAEEILGQHFSRFYLPEDLRLGKPDRDLNSAAVDGRHEIAGWRVRKDGSRFWATVVITAMRDKEGSLYGFSKMTRDLTQRRQAEEKFQLVVEASPTGLLMMSREGSIQLLNAQLEVLFGYQRDELLGRSIEVLVPERFREQHPGHRLAFFSAPTSRAMGMGRDLYGLRKDGSEFPVEIGLNPIETDEGMAVMATVIDITARKRAETTLAQHRDELERSNKDLEQFAYVASHDLQEPLRAVAGCVQLLKKRYHGQLDERANEYIGHAVDGAKRMQSLIDDLLTYSRIGRAESSHRAVSCADALTVALKNLSVSVQESGAQVTWDVLPVVAGEAVQITMLLQNLLANALKFRKPSENPRIHIGVVRDGTRATFSVSDNGIGISQEHFERIFGVFQRLHTRSEYPGTGIGLALCKRIVEHRGGRIWVESKPGEGTTFRFVLLLSAEDSP
jgi:PAS domain S-box-containing protein